MTTSPEKTTEQPVEEAIVRALMISAPVPYTPLRVGATLGRDSKGHRRVVMELEKEFAHRFPPYVLPRLLDVPSIVQILRQSN